MAEDPIWERELNPRVAVPDAVSIYGEWPQWAEATRRARRHEADLRYGPHPREVLDLFRAEDAKGTVMFIHGGYWRAFSKNDFSWVADGFVDLGYSVAVLNYPLCPDVTLRDIVGSTRRAFAALHGEHLGSAERDRVVVTGHSAGGYLTGLMLATDWTEFGMPADPIRTAIPISGVFELLNLTRTSMNQAIRLTESEALALTLTTEPPKSRARLTLVVGGDESAEFHRQSEALAAAWPSLGGTVLDIPGRNHFDVIEDLRRPGTVLHDAVLAGLA